MLMEVAQKCKSDEVVGTEGGTTAETSK